MSAVRCPTARSNAGTPSCVITVAAMNTPVTAPASAGPAPPEATHSGTTGRSSA
ncbi:MAG TPA: hypothetical protein VGH76_25985 [Actinomycetospora sp.]|jgi:hypothetical protein|uniref:hypothetical protein n=1 Tax=Actinomycetospora sp. TaxID=1872135 RepID=UPI002F40DDF6